MNFTGKTIWITGASSGIGKAVSLELSKENVHLILSGRNENALMEVGELCKKNGSSAQIIPFDLGAKESCLTAEPFVLSCFRSCPDVA